ncbi:G-rich domain on putative tyrosine kinase [Belliella buryatensis]|uniref:G-rich domain on putative tyrosine kinase n=1 Tax=Belliella buryatensis TaxID=1500549 RepID=A0A239CUN4_9BACT|nr:Wzz/FepE/Etk N-terminal domain-containing protein [Belliella buryatensis]SNS23063.1 G-rich domain on putative tyrosine kinase [Belliella buryatensis]
MSTNPSQTPQKDDDEIDLLALAKTIWSQRRKVISITITFMLIGLAVAILSPKEFTASSTFIPQTSESAKGGGSLGGLASLAGINLGSMGGGSEIPPALYPKFTSSVKFRKALLQAPINVEGIKESVSYAKYYEEVAQPGLLANIKKYTIGLPGLILKALRGTSEETLLQTEEGDLIKLTEAEVEHFKRLESQLSVSPNEKEGFVSISFVMPEPLMAAQMAKYAQELLQNEVIAYKISNAREQLNFTEERFAEKKADFDQIQARLANFRDRNQNISSATAMNQLQRLEAEYNFAFNIYTELAKQLEQAKLQVSKDTPIFSVIQPVTIPTEKSAPKRPLILVIFTILGLILALAYIFGSEFLKGVKEQWKEV